MYMHMSSVKWAHAQGGLQAVKYDLNVEYKDDKEEIIDSGVHPEEVGRN